MHQFKDLRVWKKAFSLSVSFHKIAAGFPKDEKYGLTSQAKRSVVSISSNIAEGAGREGKKEFLRFLNIANGSAFEFESQLLMIKELKWVEAGDFVGLNSELDSVKNMLFRLQQTLREDPKQLKEPSEQYFVPGN